MVPGETTQIKLHIQNDLLEWLEETCERRERSKSYIFNRALQRMKHHDEANARLRAGKKSGPRAA